MKKTITFSVMLLMTVYLTAQDITISFQPKVAGTQIDSIWITNLRTNQKVKLLGSENLLLDVPTGIDLIHNNEGNGYLFPNPGYGDATLVFFTARDQNVAVYVYNISGQVLEIKRQELSPGQHTFQLKFPVIGLYVVSVQTEDGGLSFKAACMGMKMQECHIEYAGSESPKHLKSTFTGKTLGYTLGDILHYSVFSGNNNTIVTDSPTTIKVYSVEFFECKDADNQNYPIVKIGDQWWMAKNLKTTKYNDGPDFPNVTDLNTWLNLSTGAYCWYNNDAATNKNLYGALYNWYAVNAGKLCPAGWHVPSDTEWTTLTTYLGGSIVGGGKMKETGTAHWQSPNKGATNESGFSALPGGYRDYNVSFHYVGNYGFWWSSSESSTNNALSWYLNYNYTYVYRWDEAKRLGFSIRCVRDDLSVITADPDSITINSVILGGEVTYDGGCAVTERGICYGTTQTPTLEGNKVIIGSGKGAFKTKVTGLASNTIYYTRAYATNSHGTTYGEQRVLKTMTGIVGDADGNNYYTVTIGTRVWMAENLKTTKYNDGKPISNVTDKADWASLTTGAYCWYNNDSMKYGATYGALYNWYAVNTDKLCLIGWHVPTDAEWTTLIDFLGGYDVAGGKMKEIGTTHWTSPNTGASNESGFSALPGGYRDFSGTFKGIGIGGIWRSSTEYSVDQSWNRYIGNYIPYVSQGRDYKTNGYSVRCLRDN